MRFRPQAISEFPNDNPALHLGVRWLCLTPTAEPRAVRRVEPDAALTLTGASAASSSPPARVTHLGSPQSSGAPLDLPSAPQLSAPPVDAVSFTPRAEASSVPPPVAALCERFVSPVTAHDPTLDSALDEALLEVLEALDTPQATSAGFDADTQSLIEELADTVASALSWELDTPRATALPPVAACASEAIEGGSFSAALSDTIITTPSASTPHVEPCDAELDRAPRHRRSPIRERSPRFLTALIRDVTEPSAIAS